MALNSSSFKKVISIIHNQYKNYDVVILMEVFSNVPNVVPLTDIKQKYLIARPDSVLPLYMMIQSKIYHKKPRTYYKNICIIIVRQPSEHIWCMHTRALVLLSGRQWKGHFSAFPLQRCLGSMKPFVFANIWLQLSAYCMMTLTPD